jgi:hypothetical protein
MWKNRLLSRVGASGKSSRSHSAGEAFIPNQTNRMAKPLIRLPDPLEFSDPIKYLRASHVVIVAQVELLHTLVKEAEQQGVSKSFSTHPDWVSSLYFFSRVLPIHERDEEIAIFPLLIANLTHVGFLLPIRQSDFWKIATRAWSSRPKRSCGPGNDMSTPPEGARP